MNRIGLLGGAVLGALVSTPLMAQDYKQPVVQRDTVPIQLTQQQIKSLQRTLNQRGYGTLKIDGLWGPNTAGSLKKFQSANQLNATGELDLTTELKLGMATPATAMATPVPRPAPVVTPSSLPAPTPAAASTVPAAPPPAVVMAPAARLTPAAESSAPGASTPAPVGTAPTPRGPQPRPTSGANSFTESQAKDRIEGNGYQAVNGLQLDSSGVWRGTASRNGQPVQVWLDYQGDIGQQ